MGKKSKKQEHNYWEGEDNSADLNEAEHEVDGAEEPDKENEKANKLSHDNDEDVVIIEDVDDSESSEAEEAVEDEEFMADYSEQEMEEALENVKTMLRKRKEEETLPKTEQLFLQVIEPECKASRVVPVIHVIQALQHANIVSLKVEENIEENISELDAASIPVAYSKDSKKQLDKRAMKECPDDREVCLKFIAKYMVSDGKIIRDADEEDDKIKRPANIEELKDAIQEISTVKTSIPASSVMSELIKSKYIELESATGEKTRKKGSKAPVGPGGLRIKYNENKIFKDGGESSGFDWKGTLLFLFILSILVAQLLPYIIK